MPVLGYIHWVLADNFGWIVGSSQHFGLCSVDRTSFKRTPRPSAFVLAQIARRNMV
jgi:beta-glucosidase